MRWKTFCAGNVLCEHEGYAGFKYFSIAENTISQFQQQQWSLWTNTVPAVADRIEEQLCFRDKRQETLSQDHLLLLGHMYILTFQEWIPGSFLLCKHFPSIVHFVSKKLVSHSLVWEIITNPDF